MTRPYFFSLEGEAMNLNAEPPAQASIPLAYAMDKLSKAALIDLALDFVRRAHGADMTDEQVMDELVSTYLPSVCRERGDKVPKLHFAYGKCLKASQPYREYRERMAAP